VADAICRSSKRALGQLSTTASWPGGSCRQSPASSQQSCGTCSGMVALVVNHTRPSVTSSQRPWSSAARRMALPSVNAHCRGAEEADDSCERLIKVVLMGYSFCVVVRGILGLSQGKLQ
jgi:hypothetical protein